MVDVSGEDQPLTALGDLAHVVEPDVCVLVIGETNNVDFYREVTRGLGAADYLAKPLTRDNVARHFSAFLRGKTPASQAALGGRGHRDHRRARRRRRHHARGQPGLEFRRADAPAHGACSIPTCSAAAPPSC